MSSVSCRAMVVSAAFALTTAAPALAQYCTPSVTTPCAGNEYISNVSVGTINNSTACGLGYEDFSSTLSTSVVQLGTVPITATVSAFFTGDQVSVFCDWNANGVLDDAGEVTTLVDPGTHVYAGVISVPGSAVVGSTRMRVRLNYAAVPPACGNTAYGNAEDYTLVVNPTSSPTNPSVTGTATPSTCLQGQVVVLAATAVPGQNPTSTGLAVSGDLTGMGGGPAVAFLDNGIAPDVTAGDNIFTTQATVPLTQLDGPVSIALTVSDAQARVGTGNTGFQAGYCSADTTYPCGGNEYISNVAIGAINNSTFCSTGYENFASLSAAVSQGGSASIAATVSTWFSTDSVTVFCDWNMNGVLNDPGEETLLTDPGTHTYSGSIAVPGTALLGTTRMRVRLNYGVNPGPCGITAFGNIEDYSVVVGPPAPPANDNCAAAFSLAAFQSGLTTLATNDGSSTCDATGNDVWYAYTAGALDGTLNLDTCGSTTDTVISVYAACGGAQLACDDNSAACGGGAASVSLVVTPGQSLVIRVSDKGAGGAYVLNSSFDPTPVSPCNGTELTTLYASNNGGSNGGQVFFDLIVTKASGITISQIDINSDEPGNQAFGLSVYTTPTTYIGSEASAGAWTLVSSGGGLLSGVLNTPSIAAVTPFHLAPGSYGVTLVLNSVAGFSYTNGTGANQVYSNADLTINLGAANNAPFAGAPFTPRVFNGTLRYDCITGPTTYCAPTAPGTSHSCVPTIAGTANPNVAHTGTCVITVSNVEGLQSGIVFYGLTTFNAPWCSQGGGNSFLCVKSPLERTGVQNSGGTFGACDGTLTLDWNAFQLAHPGGVVGNPWSVGDKAYVQGWFRDPPSCKTTFLSEALEMTYQP